MADIIIRRPDRPPVVVNDTDPTSGGVKVVVKKGDKGDPGDDHVYVGDTAPSPRGTYTVWVKKSPTG